ncbi:MAG: matrixin family metalloprotease [Candidatus Doudnabacteria bacterium]|nr:matrixin family metalloprotease [Candidatus Doudnabacteria bacterium]
MMKVVKNVVVVALLSAVGFYVYTNYFNICSQTSYSVGNIDPKFGITAENFAEIAQETESVWESAFKREFFKYDPNAKFKINLVFDDRQQRTIDEKNTRDQIGTKEQEYRKIVDAYEQSLAEHNEKNAAYEAALTAYDQRLNQYNNDVDYWNNNGGAPAQQFNRLQQEKTALQRESRRLEGERQVLNNEVIELNVSVAIINEQAKTLNLDVDAYNGKFGTSREFDQGTYTGDAINIYQFSEESDLKLVLAHEFGHALGLDHVDDPYAVMYHLMELQNIKNLQLTDSDISALKSSCNL